MFEGWADFYLLIGSAAGALIGLLFVVATLTHGVDRDRALKAASLYMTPTVGHFGMVLVLSGLALTPGVGPGAAALVVAVAAVAGFAWLTTNIFRFPSAGTPTAPHWTDIWFCAIGGAAAYAVLGAVAAWIALGRAGGAYALAAVLMGLLLLGIRNAWDLVTFITASRNANPDG